MSCSKEEFEDMEELKKIWLRSEKLTDLQADCLKKFQEDLEKLGEGLEKIGYTQTGRLIDDSDFVKNVSRAGIIGASVGSSMRLKMEELKIKATNLGMSDLAFAQLMDICNRSGENPEDLLNSMINSLNSTSGLKKLPPDLTELFKKAVFEESYKELPKEGKGRVKAKPKDHKKQQRKRKRDQRRSRNNKRH